MACKMDPGQYSRVENNKTDIALSSIVKIADALKVEVAELFTAGTVFKEVNSADKSLMEKLRLLDGLEEKDRQSLFHIIDTFIAKKKLKDNLADVLKQA